MKYDQTYQSMKDIRRCNNMIERTNQWKQIRKYDRKIEYIDGDEGRSWR